MSEHYVSLCRGVCSAGALLVGIALASPALAAPFVYVPSANASAVSVVDLATNRLVATVPVGRAPYGVAANPIGTRVYVLDTMDHSVSVIDAATNTVVGSVPVGDTGADGHGIAVTPDGSRVLVANAEDNTLSVIDTAANGVVGSPIPVGAHPLGIAIDPAGQRAYVANNEDNSVSIVDLAAGAPLGAISVGAAPIGVAIDPTGSRAYVTTSEGVTAIDLSSPSSPVASSTTAFAGAYGVAVSPDGARVYVTSREGHALLAIDATTAAPLGAPLDLGASACGVDVAPDGGRVYAALCDADTVAIVSADASTVLDTIGVLSGPMALGRFVSNARPVAQAQSVTALPAGATPIALTGIDANNDALTFTVVQAPAHGTLTGTPPLLTYTAAASYAGTDRFTFAASDGVATSDPAAVSIAVLAPTSTAIAASATASNYGQPVTFTATVSSASGSPTGQVQFADNGVPIGSSGVANRTASLTVTSLGAGAHAITASYAPSGAFAPSSSAAVSETVAKASGTATLAMTGLTPTYSDLDTFTATYTPSVPGGPAPAYVTFKIGTQVMGTAPVVRSSTAYQAKWTGPLVEPTPATRQLKPDFHTVTAAFSDPSFTVTSPAKAITIQAEDARVSYSGPKSFTLGGATTVPLTVVVKDITAVPGDPAYDPNPGNIGNAQVAFVDRSTNAIVGTVWVTPSGTDATVGTASFDWPVKLGTAKSKSYTIGFIVSYYYKRNSPTDNVTIVVKK